MELLMKTLFLCLAVLAVEAVKLKFEAQSKQPNIREEKEQAGPYLPNWDSIDSRPLPAWYDEAKFGIFMHWGVYSVPAFQTEWFWRRWKDGLPQFVNFMKENYPPNFQYPDFGPQFTAEMFDANHFADVLQASGAQYVVLTSKHHEGFTNYASNFSWNWNSVDLGPNRDLVGEMAEAVRSRTSIKFGLYYSLYEWFHPLFLKDQANNWETQDYMKMVMRPQLHEIVNKYKPYVIWSDGSGGGPDTYWNSTDFLAWLYNESPVKDYVVVNDRWCDGCGCHHGGYFTCADRYNPVKDYVVVNDRWGHNDICHHGGYYTCHDRYNPVRDFVVVNDRWGHSIHCHHGGFYTCHDRYNPVYLFYQYNSPVKDYVAVNDRWGDNDIRCNHGGYYTCQDRYNPGVLQAHKWENAMTIDKSSWGYRRDTSIQDFLTMDEITTIMAETFSCGGNLLMNFGPTHDGRIIPIFEERLRQTGEWLAVNGEAVYASKPWRAQNDTLTPGIWYTSKNSTVYTFVLDWPAHNVLDLGSPQPTAATTVTMLGVTTPLQWMKGSKPGVTMSVRFPTLAGPQLPCDYAWILKMEGVL